MEQTINLEKWLVLLSVTKYKKTNKHNIHITHQWCWEASCRHLRHALCSQPTQLFGHSCAGTSHSKKEKNKNPNSISPRLAFLHKNQNPCLYLFPPPDVEPCRWPSMFECAKIISALFNIDTKLCLSQSVAVNNLFSLPAILYCLTMSCEFYLRGRKHKSVVLK